MLDMVVTQSLESPLRSVNPAEREAGSEWVLVLLDASQLYYSGQR